MRALPLIALIAAALGGCADAVDPTLGTDRAFSVYGFLDPTADRQAVRVVPIAEAIGADTARVLAAEVTSVEPATGRTATWRDSVVTYVDGSVGHVFVADYTPTPGAAVALTVRETAGARREATVAVEVPPLARPAVGAPESDGRVVYPVRLTAPRVIATDVVYRVVGWPSAPADTVAVRDPSPPAFEALAGGAWALDLDFLATARAFLRSPAARGARLRLVDVAVEAFVADAGWAVPPGGFDLDQIVEPGTFSNVAGGFGFVGAGYRAASARWVPSLVTQSRAGFVVEDDPASVLFVNEVSAEGWVELYNPTLEAVPIGGYEVVTDLGEAAVPAGTTVGGGAFVVVEAPLATGRRQVELRSAGGRVALQLEVPDLYEAGFGSYGAYPDGRSRRLGEVAGFREADLFRGRTVPTPGAPNRIAGRFPVVNEVFTAGANGWVEVVVPLDVELLRVTSDADVPFGAWPSARGPFSVADEAPGRLDLVQSGGEVVVAVQLNAGTPPRVVDVRAYGPQSPKRSSGLLPDGDRASWRGGLAPTRNAPNAAARWANF